MLLQLLERDSWLDCHIEVRNADLEHLSHPDGVYDDASVDGDQHARPVGSSALWNKRDLVLCRDLHDCLDLGRRLREDHEVGRVLEHFFGSHSGVICCVRKQIGRLPEHLALTKCDNQSSFNLLAQGRIHHLYLHPPHVFGFLEPSSIVP